MENIRGNSVRAILASFLIITSSIGADTDQLDRLPGWKYSVQVREGNTTREQAVNNPIYLHGFDILHAKAMNGNGTTIAFLESGVDRNHKQFKRDQIEIIDFSLKGGIFSNPSRLRIKEDVREDARNLHGNHVMGVSLGQPQNSTPHTSTEKRPHHPGGCCPEAKGILYKYSSFLHQNSKYFNCEGVAILSVKEFENPSLLEEDADEIYHFGKKCTWEQYFDRLQPPLTSDEKTYIYETPIDQSPLKALEAAITGPAFPINWSSIP